MKKLVCFLSTILILLVEIFFFIPTSHAQKMLPPIDVSLALDNSQVTLGSSSHLIFKVTPGKDISEARVTFELPEQIRLLAGDTEWKGPLQKGETKEFSIYVQLVGKGEFSVFAGVLCSGPGTSFGRRAHLNFLAASEEVTVSADPIILMKMKKAKTAKEKKALHGSAAVETPPTAPKELTPQEKALDKAVKELEKEKKKLKNPAIPANEDLQISGAEGITSLLVTPQAATASYTVQGNAYYKDSGGVSHPVRYGGVLITDSVGTTLAEGNTTANGSYSVSLSSTAGTVISVYIHTRSSGSLVEVAGASTVYYMTSSAYTVPASGSITISDMTAGAVTVNSTTDSDAGRAFSVLDCMVQYVVEAYLLRGSLLPAVSVSFPVSGDVSYYSGGAMYILRADALDWDVLGHEFGHFLSDKGASANFDNSPGGSHFGTTTLQAYNRSDGTVVPANTKSNGIRLAWSEGWATFFSVACQMEPITNSLGISLPSIPNTGTNTYHDTEDSSITNNLETIGDGATSGESSGYASENSIMAALWDLLDSAQDTSSDSAAKDQVDTSHSTMWSLVNAGANDDVGKFYNYLFSILSSNIPLLLQVSDIFAMNNIGPELTEPADNTIVSGGVSPTFTWQANGDPNTAYKHNNFLLGISKDDFSSFVITKSGITDTTYTFSDSDWRTVVAAADTNTTFKWVVLGYNDASPQLPSGSGFISNAHSFSIKEYHVQITWSPTGADVDLHLRPPEGSSDSSSSYSGDCAYYNRNPSWGTSGDSTDDPSLDRDCITSCAEENITLDRVTTPGTYKVIVHYYSDHSMGPASVNLKIYQFSQVIYTASQTLSATGDLWTAYEVTVGSGKPSIVPINEISVDKDTHPAYRFLKKEEPLK